MSGSNNIDDLARALGGIHSLSNMQPTRGLLLRLFRE